MRRLLFPGIIVKYLSAKRLFFLSFGLAEVSDSAQLMLLT